MILTGNKAKRKFNELYSPSDKPREFKIIIAGVPFLVQSYEKGIFANLAPIAKTTSLLTAVYCIRLDFTTMKAIPEGKINGRMQAILNNIDVADIQKRIEYNQHVMPRKYECELYNDSARGYFHEGGYWIAFDNGAGPGAMDVFPYEEEALKYLGTA